MSEFLSRKSKLIAVLISALLPLFLVTTLVLAVTTVGANITTDGTITVQNVTATDDQLILDVAAGGAARFAGTIQPADLTAARTYTLPDATGTVVLHNLAQTLTNKTFGDNITLQNGETISNATDAYISLGGKVIVAGAALGSQLRSSQTTAPVVTNGGGTLITCTNGAGTADTCTDMRGQARVTTAVNTNPIVVTFNVPYATAPVCTISAGNTATADDIADLVVTTSTTALTITPDNAWAADAKIINYICIE